LISQASSIDEEDPISIEEYEDEGDILVRVMTVL
jgi:hypothetical protein